MSFWCLVPLVATSIPMLCLCFFCETNSIREICCCLEGVCLVGFVCLLVLVVVVVFCYLFGCAPVWFGFEVNATKICGLWNI